MLVSMNVPNLGGLSLHAQTGAGNNPRPLPPLAPQNQGSGRTQIVESLRRSIIAEIFKANPMLALARSMGIDVTDLEKAMVDANAALNQPTYDALRRAQHWLITYSLLLERQLVIVGALPPPKPEPEPEPDPEPTPDPPDPALDLAPCPDRDRPPGDNPLPPCDRSMPSALWQARDDNDKDDSDDESYTTAGEESPGQSPPRNQYVYESELRKKPIRPVDDGLGGDDDANPAVQQPRRAATLFDAILAFERAFTANVKATRAWDAARQKREYQLSYAADAQEHYDDAKTEKLRLYFNEMRMKAWKAEREAMNALENAIAELHSADAVVEMALEDVSRMDPEKAIVLRERMTAHVRKTRKNFSD